jgi:hypothetical protein
LGRNHAGRPRHRLVRAEGTRFGLADADALEPDATSALTDERRVFRDERPWPQDDTASHDRGQDRRRSQDHRQAFDRSPQDDGKTHHGEAQDGETHYREAWHPQDHRTAQERDALDQEADDTSELDDS